MRIPNPLRSIFADIANSDTNLKDTGESFKADNSDLDLFLQDLTALPDNARDNLVKEIRIEELEDLLNMAFTKGLLPLMKGLPVIYKKLKF